MKKKGKKRWKLAIQVSIIMTVIMLSLITIIAFITINGSKNMFLESQNDNIGNLMLKNWTLYMSYDVVPAVVDEWEKDPDLIRRPYTEEEKKIKELIDKKMILPETYSLDEFENLDADKSGFLKACYDNAADMYDKQTEIGEYCGLYCVAFQEDGSGRVILQSDEDTTKDDHGFGKTWEGDIHDYPHLVEILSEMKESPDLVETEETDEADETEEAEETEVQGFEFDLNFATITDEESGAELYVAYAPMYSDDGELKYVVFEEYDWTSFSATLNDHLKEIILFGVIGTLIADVILVLFIYLLAVRPVSRINRGVREYMESKDSATVTAEMMQIRSKNEIGNLADSISDMSIEIDTYMRENLRLNSERERVEVELNLATNIQASQLPSDFPAFPDRNEFDVFASMTPAKEVGGDFYDFFLIDEDHLGLVIADVSGKGVPAAMFMMISKMMIKSYTESGFSPAEVLEKTNQHIFENNKEKMFVTVWLGILEISTGKVTAANAGHEYPVLRQPDGCFELLKDKHGFVIGLRKNKKYTDYEFELQKGATLFVYTDGVAEATDKDNKLYGLDRMIEALNSDSETDPEQLINNVKSSVDEYVGDAPQFDDLTMLCIRYNG